jgi:endonuclease III
MNNLKKAYIILFNHKNEMENFMDHYLFKKIKINKNTFLNNKKDFLRFIVFCLNTAQKAKKENIKGGKEYFRNQYKNMVTLLKKNDIKSLQNLVYKSPGVGQKIGSMILEIIYMYSNKRNDNYAKDLFLPLDTHVIRLFEDSFKQKNILKEYELKIKNKNFLNFQESLKKYSNGMPIIYFDYLWFIGKMFCNKIDEKNENNRGYRLCKYCWIKSCCSNNKKWS